MPVSAITNFLPMEEVNICFKVIYRVLYLEKIGVKITHEDQQTHLAFNYFTCCTYATINYLFGLHVLQFC